MKALLSILSLMMMCACGVNTKSTSSVSTPAQILGRAEDALSKVGVEFNTDGTLTHCESDYKRTCTARAQLMKKYIDKAFAIYTTEDQMPAAELKKIKPLTTCMNLLNESIADSTSKFCRL